MKTEIIFLKNINKDVTFLIGTNAKDNFDVIDAGSPDDYWFHVKDVPSCHVVAKIPEGADSKIVRSIIKRAAVLCKQYSKYVSNKNVEIIYTKIKNVQKTEVAGSVLTKSVSTVSI